MLVGKDVGPFRIDDELGSGAMGTVYLALNRETGEFVALKIIADVLLGNETAVKRFEREADILKQLKHPNVVRLKGTGRYKKKTPFFIMEYVEGESLDRILARRGSAGKNGRFSWEEVVAIGRQLCDALQHAHQKGIIHRDIKPSNVMILPDGTVKLTDFGIAKDVDVTALTGANVTVGTAAYMSPEQCKGEKNLSHKSDLYSLGVVFYELLTGRKPFIKDGPVEMFLAHVNDKPDRPSQFVMDIPVWLDTLVIQLMEKRPEHRPFDAAMVRKVLDEIEQKAVDQHSAGVDAATARGVDRVPNRAPADETDREAARTLRGAVTRKRIRKKFVPLIDRPWVKAVGLASVLALMGGFIYFMTRPPSAEQLFRLVRADVEAKEVDRLLQHGQRYLALYGGRGDEAARQVRAWWDGAWADRREQQLHNRFNSKLMNAANDDGERIAFDALKAENDGDIDEARGRWKVLDDKFKDNPDPDQRAYSLVARKKTLDLQNLDRRKGNLLNNISLIRMGRPPERKADDAAELRMEEAVRFEDLGDTPAAYERYATFRDNHVKELEPRVWVVFAAWRARLLKSQAVNAEKDKDFRKDLLRERLAQVTSVAPTADPTQRHQAAMIARDLADLYGRDQSREIAEIVRVAKQKLAELTRP